MKIIVCRWLAICNWWVFVKHGSKCSSEFVHYFKFQFGFDKAVESEILILFVKWCKQYMTFSFTLLLSVKPDSILYSLVCAQLPIYNYWICPFLFSGNREPIKVAKFPRRWKWERTYRKIALLIVLKISKFLFSW